MHFAEFHDDLRSVAGDVLAKEHDIDWPVLVDAGWTGLEVPDDLGGAGATFAETAVILDQIGRAASANSYLGGAALAVGVLNHVDRSGVVDELFGTVVGGGGRLAVVTGEFNVAAGELTGRAELVPDAVGADRLLVLVADGVAVVATSELSVTGRPVVDETRRLATVTADAAAVEAVLPFATPAASEAIRDRIAVALACDSLGIAEHMLRTTVDYVKVRQQFGRPIGSFQAVKHACADMLVAVEVSRQLVGDAVAAVTDGADAEVAAAMAKSYACSAAVDIAGTAMQLHGGIGYTWESGIHTYLKRAALNRSLFGSPAALRQRIAQRYQVKRK